MDPTGPSTAPIASAPESKTRSRPNLLITGTPGTGKTTTAEALAEATGFTHINVGDLIKAKQLHDGRDEAHDCFILNEDKVCDELEDVMTPGGRIVDFHTCDFFPERWFDLVLVLRADNTVLYNRLAKRGYAQAKIQENVQAEILQVVRDEARESYKDVVELASDTVEQLESNVERAVGWIKAWSAKHT